MSDVTEDPATRHARLVAGARPLVDRAIAASEVGDIIAEWFETIAPSGASLATVVNLLAHGQTGVMLSRLRAAGCQTQAKWIEALSRDDIRVTAEEVIATEMLIGHGVGLAAGRKPDADAFTTAREFFRLLPNAEQGFGRGIDISLARDPLALQNLVHILRQRVENFGRVTKERPNRMDAELTSIIERHRVAPSIENYWDEPRYYFPRLEMVFAFDALRRHAPDIYLDILDGFPHPEPVRQMLAFPHLALDGITGLLRIAPPAFDETGQWLPESKTPMFLLSLVTSALLSEPDAQAETFRRGVDVVLTDLALRPDATDLGFAWANWLVRRGNIGRRGIAAPDRQERLLAILAALAGKLGHHPRPLEWVHEAKDQWRSRERLVTILLPFCRPDHKEPSNALDLVEKAASRGLFELTGIEQSQLATRATEATIVAHALELVPGLAARIPDVWAKLMPQRDKARHRRSFSDVYPQSPGLFLAIWLMHPLFLLASKADAAAQSLWVALEAIAREGRLTEYEAPGIDYGWPFVQRSLAMLWPSVFPDRPLRGTPGNLADFLQPFAQPDVPFLGIVLSLRLNGATAVELSDACGGRVFLSRLLRAAGEDVRERCVRLGRVPETGEIDAILEELAVAVDCAVQNF